MRYFAVIHVETVLVPMKACIERPEGHYESARAKNIVNTPPGIFTAQMPNAAPIDKAAVRAANSYDLGFAGNLPEAYQSDARCPVLVTLGKNGSFTIKSIDPNKAYRDRRYIKKTLFQWYVHGSIVAGSRNTHNVWAGGIRDMD